MSWKCNITNIHIERYLEVIYHGRSWKDFRTIISIAESTGFFYPYYSYFHFSLSRFPQQEVHPEGLGRLQKCLVGQLQ